jgi:hypothetical protein
VIVAVPFDDVTELEDEGLANALPVFRGAVFDAVVSVGTNAATLVTLLQTPDSIRAFAAWIRRRHAQADTSIEVSAKHGDLSVRLTVKGDISIEVLTEFLTRAFEDRTPQH